MFPSFGFHFSPGDLLCSKTFQKVASLDVETQSKDEFQILVKYGIIDPSNLLSNLSDVLGCCGQYLAKAVLNAENRFEHLLNFLYLQQDNFACFGFGIVRKQDETCFEISTFHDSAADLMISKTISGSFFLCILTSQLPIKNLDIVMRKFDYVLREFPNISRDHCKYFDGENVEITVFANWNEMVCYQKSVGVAMETMLAYDKEKEMKVICFEADDFMRRLLVSLLPLDPSFEKCYRLMTVIKFKEAELSRIHGSKKKRNDNLSSRQLKISMKELEKELKQLYFVKFENITEMNSFLPDALTYMGTNLRLWSTDDVALDVSFYEMIENCLTLILTRYNNGNCVIRNNTLFYNAEDVNEAFAMFDNKPFIAVKSDIYDFKKWLDMKFLHMYPFCLVKSFPSTSDSLLLFDTDIIYGFGTVALERAWRKKRAEVEAETFPCRNPEHKYPRYWKCTTCNIFVKFNEKEISCECGNHLIKNVEFRCTSSGGRVCVQKHVSSSRPFEQPYKHTVGSKENKNTYNIVLFGPVASGKSTVVNAAMNYCEYFSYDRAARSHSLNAPVPYNFTILDADYHEQIVKSEKLAPEDSPEDFENKSHTTQTPKIYECSYKGKGFRFMDTVGYGFSTECGGYNLSLWRTLKHIDAVWITFSATQDLSNIDSWIGHMIEMIPKKIFSRIYFLFTNTQGKHSLRFNSNVNIVAQSISQFKDIPFGERNVFAIENNCLKYLYAHNAGFSLSDVSVSISNTWTSSRDVILELLEKASVDKPNDEDVYFLNNLYFLLFRFKKLSPEIKDCLRDCNDILVNNYQTSTPALNKKIPSYGDAMAALVKLESKKLIFEDSPHHQLLVEFIMTFEDYVKKQPSRRFGLMSDFSKKVFTALFS